MLHFRSVLVVGLLGGLSVAGFAPDPAVSPPLAKKIPQKLEQHGDVRIDEFFWLKDKSNPAVIKHLEAENAYTAAMLKPTEPLQATLYKECLARIKQTDLSVPVKDRGYWYYTRTVEGKQYSIHCRRKETLDAPEELLLDGNELAKGQKFFSIGRTRVSDDGNLLAFSTDGTGFREYQLSVKDLRSGRLIEVKLVKAPAFEWAADNKTLFYLSEDEAKRAHKVWRHALGQPRAKDSLLYEEKDELFWLELSRTRDGKLLFHSSVSYTSTEARFLPTDKPTGEWKTILKREPGHEYDVVHRDGTFFIRTNKNATNFKVVTCPIDKTDPVNWVDWMKYDPATFIESVATFSNHVVLSARMDGLPQLIVRSIKSGDQYRIDFPEPAYEVQLSANPEFDSSTIRFHYSSMVIPVSDYSYDLNSRTRKLLKKKEVPGYDSTKYATEQAFATAADGTRIPVSLVYRKGLKMDGTAPCLLYGYGSYGYSLAVEFDSTRLSLLDRGVLYAQAHIRGGSELGRTWYDSGKMLKKMNTFTDFVACADFLVKQKYCARDRLAIQGGSAGGLLIAVTLNLRPDLCKAAVLQVPFIDVLTSMLDESLPLTVQEFQQWGNPKVKTEYDYMKNYCPYTNMKATAYPSMLVMTSLNDSQVLFHEPTKYVAKLRTLKTDKNLFLLRCNMDAGHGGASGRYDHLKETALVMAFVLDQAGIKK